MATRGRETVDVVRERAPAEDVHLRRLHGIEGPIDEAVVTARPYPLLGWRLLPVHAMSLGRAARGGREGDRRLGRRVDVGHTLLYRGAQGAGCGVKKPVAENEGRLLEREHPALHVVDVTPAQLVKVANVAARGDASAALVPRAGRPEPECLQDGEAGVFDALMVVRDREVADVVDFPRGHAAPTGLDPGIRHGGPLRSAAPAPRSPPSACRLPR